MLGHKPFYWGHHRRYIAIFGTLFNDISIVRKSSDPSTADRTIKVPLSFVQKDKVLERFHQNPALRESWNNIFPRMAFEMGSPVYAGYRKENTVHRSMIGRDGTKASMQYSPAPYDINFILTVFATKIEDGLQIVEQILPFFQPEYTVNAKEIPEFGLERDIHVVLNSIAMNDNVEGGFEEGRLIEWTLDFTLKGFFYGPASISGVITKVDAKTFFNPEMSGDPVSHLHLEGDPATRSITTTIRN